MFVFQAEDGIRDVAVTGVQTCALPISFPAKVKVQPSVETKEGWTFTFAGNVNAFYVFEREARSEERRVGKGRRGRKRRFELKIKSYHIESKRTYLSIHLLDVHMSASFV